MKQWEMKFDEAVKAELIDGLDMLEDEELYLSDIVGKILETDMSNGCMFCCEDEKNFIINNWDKVGEMFDYLDKQGAGIPNLFYDSGAFVLHMFYRGLQDLLDKSGFVNQGWDNEKVCLDRKMINLILDEVGIEREFEKEQDLER